jgi:FAD synthase
MRAVHHGRHTTAPAVAVVGVWDPFTTAHRSLLSQLVDTARKTHRSSLVVLIDPQPGAFGGADRYGTSCWPVYDAVSARISLVLRSGVDAVLCMRFRQRDFAASAAEFLDAVRRTVELDELWMGELQLLGPGRTGDRAAVLEYAKQRNLRVAILPRAPVEVYDVRWLMATGQVRKAVEQVKRPPTWEVPRSLRLHLGWRTGRYQAFAIDRPGDPLTATQFELVLEPSATGLPEVNWPDRGIRYLSFVSGPADFHAVSAHHGD